MNIHLCTIESNNTTLKTGGRDFSCIIHVANPMININNSLVTFLELSSPEYHHSSRIYHEVTCRHKNTAFRPPKNNRTAATKHMDYAQYRFKASTDFARLP
ncbi:hypothetical protein KIN20_012583 [Parelaphostrongylus tenuis]|uniref:Uncharacterized protein n=1 Tax=Parelaphostrongylus tenuis TaxID=148309 RepID=A0AAD5MTJ1_PARTN|nr:hypothetical protein KIN20_012583 [Parelaphostrongylus tenuis]